jgi:thiamine-phosphate diphosphorylase
VSAPPPVPRLIAISDSRFCGGVEPMIRRLGELLEGGLPAVIIREKTLSPREVHALGRRLMPLCRRHGALLLVNDRVDVALALQADGVHLPGGSLSVPVVRGLIPAHWLLGCSCHDVVQLTDALGASYVLISPFRAPGSHASDAAPLGVEGLRDFVRKVPRLPMLALGGIEREDIRPALKAGAHGVAAISGLLRPDADVAGWLQELEIGGKNSQASSSPG